MKFTLKTQVGWGQPTSSKLTEVKKKKRVI